jgi:hypothetical protein
MDAYTVTRKLSCLCALGTTNNVPNGATIHRLCYLEMQHFPVKAAGVLGLMTGGQMIKLGVKRMGLLGQAIANGGNTNVGY